uniref:CytochromeP450 n=1 Tax=Riptortus pedestris TaxID=329032 RepID=R4WT71_RIPPE|nr:cytochromeP450 [Riptortus pedestris]
MGLIFGDWRVEVALFSSAILFYVYFKLSALFRYFEEKNIPHKKGKFLIGTILEQASLKKSLGLSIDSHYWEIKNEKLFGIYLGISPFIVVKDPEYIQRVLISDFEYFHDRNFLIDEETNPLEAHLFFLNGNRWRLLRHALSPIFTSGKLRYMYPEMKKCSDLLMKHLDKVVDGKDVDMKDIFGRFATDVIASTAFGIEPESIVNPDNKFRQMGKKFFKPSYYIYFLVFLRFSFPKLLMKLKIKTVPEDIDDFFTNLFLDVLEHRRKSGVARKDFIQLLLQLKEKGAVTVDTKEIEQNENIEKMDNESSEKIEITDLLLAAQSFVFLLAGFETTSDCLNYVAFLLSKNKKVQDKAREEVIKIKQKYGEFSYEAVKEMTYLENVIHETTRVFPPVPMLNRMCTKDYTFPDGTLLEKGSNIIIPIYSIQRDPDYYPQPDLFDPDRFNQHNSKATWLPFGDGPRNCIGKRFAMVEVKTALATILEKYYLEESKLTKYPLEFAPTMPLTPVHPLWIKIAKINS